MLSTARRARPEPALSLTVQYASRDADVPDRARLRRWVRRALRRPASVTLRIVDEAEGRALNHEYRKKDYATNVLTFAYGEEGGRLSGDIVLCAPVVRREAGEQGKTVLAHYAHLTVHGVLHLQGLEHDTEAGAREMEGLEVEILRQLGFNDPYLSEQS